MAARKYIRNKQKRMGPKKVLNERQKKFIRKYIENGGRSTVAARAAGYESPSQEGARQLKNPLIQAELEKHRKRMEKKHEVTIERLIKEWEALAFTDVSSLMDIDDETGEFVLDLREMTPEQRKLISGMELVEFKEGKGVFSMDKRKTKVTFHSKQAAMESLGRFLGIFNDKLEVTGDLTRAERVAAGRKRAALRNAEEEEVEDGA